MHWGCDSLYFADILCDKIALYNEKEEYIYPVEERLVYGNGTIWVWWSLGLNATFSAASTFSVEMHGKDKISLKSNDDKYLTISNNDEVVFNASKVGKTEIFFVKPTAHEEVELMSVDGKYLSLKPDNTIKFDANIPGTYERWKVKCVEDDGM